MISWLLHADYLYNNLLLLPALLQLHIRT